LQTGRERRNPAKCCGIKNLRRLSARVLRLRSGALWNDVMMTCKEVNQFLADYLDGELSRRQRWSLRLHLLLCRHCRQYLASYATTVRIARALGAEADETALGDPPEELVRAIMSARGKSNGKEEKDRGSLG
jgi:hypothetical protein